MLRRTRLTLPVVAGLAALAGALLPGRPALVVLLAVATGLVVDALVVRVEVRRLQEVTDEVVAFAADQEGGGPGSLRIQGGRDWQRLVAALNDVAAVMRARFVELREERARVEGLLDGLPTAVLLFGPLGLVYANPAAEELFDLHEPAGLSPVRALGVAALAQAVDEAVETGEAVTVSARRDSRELLCRATSISAEEVAVIVTDLTSLQRVEAMRRDFVANASHELKTPVTGMRALADSLHLALERDPDRARSMVERIQQEAARLSQLVRELLDLARLEEDADEARRQRVDLTALCAQQVDRLRVLAEPRDVALLVDGEAGASVVGIAEDLKLVVGNLIHNGIQYTERGGTVSVRVERRGSTAVIEVADDGIGIPERDQERIFERFYRVDKARSRAAGGTGLGLSLIRHAVERHGGTVEVASVLGEGSTFTVRLPVDGGLG